MTHEISPRYAELYWYYRSYYVDYAASVGQPLDDAAAHAYGAEHGANAFAAEGGTPPASDVRPPLPGAAATPLESEPAPGAVAPVPAPLSAVDPSNTGVPPVVSPAAAAASAVGAASAPALAGPVVSPPRRSRKGLVIGGIAAVAVLGLIGTAIVVVPGLLSSGGSTSRLDDLRSEPSTSWSYEAAGSVTSFTDDVRFEELAGDRILAVSSFDYWDWSAENEADGYYPVAWYEGIDADYEAGWAAGVAYRAAVDAAWDDFSLPYPVRSDFYPAEFEGVEPWDATYTEAHAGAFMGWYDASLEDEHGKSLPPEPVLPDDESTIAVFRASDGEELWSIRIADIVDGYSPVDDSFSVRPAGAGDRSLLVSTYTTGKDRTSSLVLLDSASGEVTSEITLDGSVHSAIVAGDLALVSQVEDAGTDDAEASILALPLAALGDEPKWTLELAADATAVLLPFDASTFGVLEISDGETEYAYHSVATGKEVAWSDGRQVVEVDGTRLAFEQSSEDEEPYEISALTADGKDAWTIEAARHAVVDGTLFVWEECARSCEDMSPIDLASGQARWKKTVDDVYPLVISGDRVLVIEIEDGTPRRQLAWLSLGSGESFSDAAPKVPADISLTDISVAQSMLFIEDGGELAAFPFTEKKALWTLDLDGDERIETIGSKLYLWNAEKLELSRLVEG